jgi:hypothetical protein
MLSRFLSIPVGSLAGTMFLWGSGRERMRIQTQGIVDGVTTYIFFVRFCTILWSTFLCDLVGSLV